MNRGARANLHSTTLKPHMTACTKSQFECSGKSCIAKTMICDGVKDCPNGEDEASDKCPTCHETGDFKCATTSRCVPLSLRCNQVNDCGDGSDENAAMCAQIGINI